jgi:hypothetical protein
MQAQATCAVLVLSYACVDVTFLAVACFLAAVYLFHPILTRLALHAGRCGAARAGWAGFAAGRQGQG